MRRIVRESVNCMSKLNPRLTENLSIEVIILEVYDSKSHNTLYLKIKYCPWCGRKL